MWLTLELKNIDYDNVRIDNTGGGRPSYFAGTTPQMRWPDGRMQGESLDLMRDLDAAYPSPPLLFENTDVDSCISQFRNIFPSRARPSSRAAFLFQGNGDPLWRGVFEETLQKTDELLGQANDGPFFCGSVISGADVAWAPFLERYRYQLPCLHRGLEPDVLQSIRDWLLGTLLWIKFLPISVVLKEMHQVGAKYSLWRGLVMPLCHPEIEGNMAELAQKEAIASQSCIDEKLWEEYASSRPYLADTPQAEAALTVTRNREAIVTDTLKRANNSPWKDKGLPTNESDLDEAMRAMVQLLVEGNIDSENTQVGALASFLDERMCVPRDMGAMSAAAIKQLAWNSTV